MEFDLDYLIDINEFDEESVESKLKKLDSIDVDIIKKYLKEREGDKAQFNKKNYLQINKNNI